MAAMQSYDEPLDWLVKIKALGRDALEFILISLLHVVFLDTVQISKSSVHCCLSAYLILHLFPQMFGTLCNLDSVQALWTTQPFLFWVSLCFKRVAVQRTQQSGPSNSSKLMQIYWKQAGRCKRCGFPTRNMNEMSKITWRTAAAACKPVTFVQA